jgi:hypothetical protein
MLIKDLSASTELDQAAMTAVHGGADDSGNSIVSGIVQLSTINAGNMIVAGPGSSLTSSNNVTANQNASIFNSQNNGDVLGLFIGFPGFVRD